MRIDRLDLRAFGGFTDKSLDLSAGNAGLHLIYGDNEAGKSTSLRAIIAWLFGIDAQTRDNYLHPHPHLRIGGQLRLRDGRTLDFIRRKGNKNTLLQADGSTALDDSALLPFLPAGLDEDLFTRLHGIDHQRLESGGKALLSQSGDLGHALFSAAMGVASPRSLLADLQHQADELFKPRATTKPVNQAIANFKQAKERIKAFSLPVAEWADMNKERAQIQASIENMDSQLQHTRKEKSRLDRLKRVNSALGQRREGLQRLQALHEVLLLPEDFEQQCHTVRYQLQQASETQAKASAKLSRLQQEADLLNVRHELLENETEIIALYKELGAVDKNMKDKPRRDAQRRLLRNEADHLLQEIRPDLKLDEAAALRPLLNNKKWLTDLAKRHSILTQKREVAQANHRDATDKHQHALQALAQQPTLIVDLSELKASIAIVRKAGNLEQRHATAQQRATREHQACEQALARLGRFTGGLGVLLTLALPMTSTLDAFEKQFQTNSEELREELRQQKAHEDNQREVEQELAALALSVVPTVAELDAARLARQQDWQVIKQHCLNLRPATAIDAALPTRYEQKTDAADHLADRLRLAADQVAKRANLEAWQKNLQSQRQTVANALAATQHAQQSWQQQWAALWSPLGIQAGTPAEMKEWVQKAESLLSKLQAAQAQQAEATSLAAECARLQATLATQMAAFAPELPELKVQGLTLEALLEVCEQHLQQQESALESKRQWQRDALEAQRCMTQADKDLQALEAEQAVWRAEWGQALTDLNLTADAHPERVTAIFEQWEAFFATFDKSEGERRRIYGIDKELKDFADKVFAFADQIGMPREGHEAAPLAEKLHQDLNLAREARASRSKLEEAQKDLIATLQEAELTIAAANQQLDELQTAARVTHPTDLAAAGEASRQKRALQQHLAKLEQELGRNGDGLSIQVLEQEAAAADIDALDATLEAVTMQLHELGQQRDALLAQRQTLQDKIKTQDGNAAAADAAEEAEQHLTAIVSGVEQYLRLQTAALILKQRIEDYRKQHQTPVLLRAGELFTQLTLGAYLRLRDEVDDAGKPVLKGIRSNQAEVAVEQMSEGTRAQLYLALRLATLEQQMQTSEPLPFIVDDILIGFDDYRTRVSLEVLAEVAQQTQVLLFTHHRRVLDLAGAVQAPAGIFTHSLS